MILFKLSLDSQDTSQIRDIMSLFEKRKAVKQEINSLLLENSKLIDPFWYCENYLRIVCGQEIASAYVRTFKDEHKVLSAIDAYPRKLLSDIHVTEEHSWLFDLNNIEYQLRTNIAHLENCLKIIKVDLEDRKLRQEEKNRLNPFNKLKEWFKARW